jgi:Tfp pilus assembly protein PilF
VLANACAHGVLCFDPLSSSLGFACIGAMLARESRPLEGWARRFLPLAALALCVVQVPRAWALVRHGQALSALGTLDLASGSLERAVDRALQACPDSVAARSLRARFAPEVQRDPELARATWEQVLALRPNRFEAWMQLGTLARRAGKRQEALADFTQAAALGIFAHHADTPHGLRLSIEHAMKEGLAKFVICTSTLAQGVNFPLKYLIVTSTRQGGEKILVRDFHNLMGRAGAPECTPKEALSSRRRQSMTSGKISGSGGGGTKRRTCLTPASPNRAKQNPPFSTITNSGRRVRRRSYSRFCRNGSISPSPIATGSKRSLPKRWRSSPTSAPTSSASSSRGAPALSEHRRVPGREHDLRGRRGRRRAG